jgi:hypothetical protein
MWICAAGRFSYGIRENLLSRLEMLDAKLYWQRVTGQHRIR